MVKASSYEDEEWMVQVAVMMSVARSVTVMMVEKTLQTGMMVAEMMGQ